MEGENIFLNSNCIRTSEGGKGLHLWWRYGYFWNDPYLHVMQKNIHSRLCDALSPLDLQIKARAISRIFSTCSRHQFT
jgi:hypothetical protein